MSFLRGSVLVKGRFVVQMDIATYSHIALKFPALPWSPGFFLRLVLVYLYSFFGKKITKLKQN